MGNFLLENNRVSHGTGKRNIHCSVAAATASGEQVPRVQAEEGGVQLAMLGSMQTPEERKVTRRRKSPSHGCPH